MALDGKLREFSATEILQLLATQRKTGCLVVENERQRACVFVLDGRIVSTRGDVPLDQDPLYRFLRRVRRLSEEQLRGIVALHAESDRDIEDLIVQGRYLESEELGALIERQILDDLTAMIEWTEGQYHFEPGRRWPYPVIVRLSIEASLIEAARRADERSRFTQLFQDGRQIVSVRDLPDPDEEIADEESELFGIIDGQHTVSEIIAVAPLSDYEANEALQRMIEAGWIEFIGRREAEATEQPAPLPNTPSTQPAMLANPLPTALTWAWEGAVTACCVGALVAMWISGQMLRGPVLDREPTTVFAAAQLRDVRMALQLYRREHGAYPKRLEDLVEDRWLEHSQLTVNGHDVHYRPELTRDQFTLDLPDTGR